MLKVKISDVMIILLTFALVPIYSLGWGWVNFSRNIVLTICAIYMVIHIKDLRWDNMAPMLGYLITIYLSSLFNKEHLDVESLLRHVLLLLEIAAIPEIITRKETVNHVAKIMSYLLGIYWIISIAVSFYIGAVPYGSGDVYFIGSKFNVAYLCVLIIFLYGISKVENFRAPKCMLYIIWLVSIFACIRINAYTGVTMMAISLILFIYENYFMKTGQRWRMIGSPFILQGMVILSGAIVIVIAGIFSTSIISHIIASLNKTGTINSRLMIYSYLGKIIQSKPLLGYGFNTDIVKVTYAENAQNGLMKIIVENGFVGAFFFLWVVWSRIKYANSGKNKVCNWYIIWIIAYIISAVIEITYSYHFILILELFYLQCMEIKEGVHKNVEGSNCYNY